MTTVVTVHGTNDTGASTASAPGQARWWQQNSSFHRRIEELVAADSGTVVVRPFVWSGLNSETARWEAAGELLSLLETLEAAGQHYCLIGHSHGGSVIAHAMTRAVAKRVPLEHLTTWIAVGTPFIETRPSRWFFARIPIWGKSAYLLSLGFLMWGVATLADYYRSLLSPSYALWDIWLLYIATVALLPVVVTFAILMYLQTPKSRIARQIERSRDRASLDKIALLYHEDDEAIAGLGSVRQVRFAPFSYRFFVPILTFVTILIPVVAAVLIATNAESTVAVINALRRLAGTDPLDAYDRLRLADPILRAIELGIYLTSAPAVVVLTRLGIPPFEAQTVLTVGLSASFYVLGLLAWWLLVNAFVIAMTLLAMGLGHLLSGLLNQATEAQVRLAALGGDALGEVAIKAGAHPPWCSTRFRPLPPRSGRADLGSQ